MSKCFRKSCNSPRRENSKYCSDRCRRLHHLEAREHSRGNCRPEQLVEHTPRAERERRWQERRAAIIAKYGAVKHESTIWVD